MVLTLGVELRVLVGTKWPGTPLTSKFSLFIRDKPCAFDYAPGNKLDLFHLDDDASALERARIKCQASGMTCGSREFEFADLVRWHASRPWSINFAYCKQGLWPGAFDLPMACRQKQTKSNEARARQ